MKKRYFIISILAVAFAVVAAITAVSCKKQDEPGRIYGTVTDKATGEPVNVAGVEIRPGGEKTVTGTEGQFEFNDITPGDYTLVITKTGYAESNDNKITVKSGQTAQKVIQIEKLPPALRIVDDNGNDISELDFGKQADDVSRLFNVFNDGINTLQWQITTTAEWIKSVSLASGTLQAGAMQSIILIIDRDKLKGGDNTTTMHVTSNDGARQITVRAESEARDLPVLNTLEATDIRMTSATLNGVIVNPGAPSYTERGFVYATSSMPTVESTISKLTVAVTSENVFSRVATGLQMNQTYYVRAYAINSVGVAYSTNEINFTPQESLPVVRTDSITNRSIADARATLNGYIVYAGEPAYTERGFVYGTAHNPSVEDDTKKTVTGSGVGPFTINLTELTEGTIYYVRAYATSTQGTAYGEEQTLDFNAVMPEVRTEEVSDLTANSVTFNGTIVSVGDPAYTERGFIYGTMPVPTFDEPDAIELKVSGSSVGAFTRSVSNLTEGNTYYVRAYAKSGDKVVYGSIIRFKAEVVDAPYVILETEGLMVQKVNLGIFSYDDAVRMCNASTVGGYTDWRLPTLNEMMVLYTNRELIGGFTTSGSNYYTTSTICSSYLHYLVNFNKGGESGCYSDSNTTKFNIRAVRSIQ